MNIIHWIKIFPGGGSNETSIWNFHQEKVYSRRNSRRKQNLDISCCYDFMKVRKWREYLTAPCEKNWARCGGLKRIHQGNSILTLEAPGEPRQRSSRRRPSLRSGAAWMAELYRVTGQNPDFFSPPEKRYILVIIHPGNKSLVCFRLLRSLATRWNWIGCSIRCPGDIWLSIGASKKKIGDFLHRFFGKFGVD